MIGTHKTADGTVMLIADMEDSHLHNLINFHLTRMENAKSAARNKVQASSFARALYEAPEVSEEDAAIIVKEGVYRLMPYLSEAWLRGTSAELRHRFLQLLERESLAMIASFSDSEVPF